MAHRRQGHSPPANAPADANWRPPDGLVTYSRIPGFQDASRLNQRVKYEGCARRMRRWRHRTHMTSSGTHIHPSIRITHTHAGFVPPAYAKCWSTKGCLIICLPWRLAVQVLGGGPEHSPAPSVPPQSPGGRPVRAAPRPCRHCKVVRLLRKLLRPTGGHSDVTSAVPSCHMVMSRMLTGRLSAATAARRRRVAKSI